MSTRVVSASARGSAGEAAEALCQQLADGFGGDTPALIMVFASTAQPLEAIAPRIAERFPGTTLLGSSTAGEFTEVGDTKGQVSAIGVAGEIVVAGGIGVGLKSDPMAAVQAATAHIPARVEGKPHRTAILLLDPFAGNGEEATLIAASVLGEPIRLAGGAAGDDLAMQRCVVSCGAEAATDAIVAAVVFSESPLGVGVSHAHSPLSPPLQVTRASGGVVHEVNGRPAWDVWVEHTRKAALATGVDPTELAPEDVGGFLLRYEAGLPNGEEHKIRAPLSREEDGSLNMACAIPEGATIRITESNAAGQLAAARSAARRAAAQLERPAAGAVVFDCICRQLILEGQFEAAVRSISEELGGVPLAGFETYGEIALDVGDFSGFHNTTTVVLAFPE